MCQIESWFSEKKKEATYTFKYTGIRDSNYLNRKTKATGSF
jgi:hypothetical protein